MSACEPNSHHVREILIFCFNIKKSAAEVYPMLSNTYGDFTISEESVVRDLDAITTMIFTMKTVK